VNLTEGLGAGANPDVGQQSAIESIGNRKDVGSKYQDGFITGMGGGTGTGAAPVIAH
jgi:cell division protein FtsZ